jgi:hypothetical protein
MNVVELLSTVNTLIQDAEKQLDACNTHELDLPAAIDLTGVSSKDNKNDPALTQFMNSVSWDVPDSEPDPGQQSQLRKYLPVDLMQIPKKATTREEAVQAIHMCERLCNLISWQNHCIKNDKFIISALIEHVFVQVSPQITDHEYVGCLWLR